MVYRSGGILQMYQGFPALIFFALKDAATRQQMIAERLNTLVHIYAYLRAKLPEQEIKEELTGNMKSLPDIMTDIDTEIKGARKKYNPIWEEMSTYSDEENNFLNILDGILYNETEVIARTKLIDSQRIEQYEAPAGNV